MNNIGLNDYRDIYVAACGRDFPSRVQGLNHEKDCDACQHFIQSLGNINDPDDDFDEDERDEP